MSVRAISDHIFNAGLFSVYRKKEQEYTQN